MHELLNKIISDTSDYRDSVDRIFSKTTLSGSLQECLSDILMRVSELYLDYRLSMRDLPDLEAASIEGGGHAVFHADIRREMEMRQRLRKDLGSSAQWALFRPDDVFCMETGLRTSQDYLNNFGLHLPEIYEETFRIEDCAKTFIRSRHSSLLAQLMIGLKHMGRNHIVFLLPALEWAADEDSWEQKT